MRTMSRYDILRYSAIRKAAAPSTGGDRMAPRPPAGQQAARRRSCHSPPRVMIGQATVPMVTVVATPEPDGPPSRNDDSTTARPAALGWPFMARSEKSMKKRPGAGGLQDGAEDGEQDDQRRRDVDRRAEDAVQRHVELGDQVGQRIALVRPGRRQVVAPQRVGEEHHRQHRHDPAGGAARRLEHQQDQDARRRRGPCGSARHSGRESRRTPRGSSRCRPSSCTR